MPLILKVVFSSEKSKETGEEKKRCLRQTAEIIVLLKVAIKGE